MSNSKPSDDSASFTVQGKGGKEERREGWKEKGGRKVWKERGKKGGKDREKEKGRGLLTLESCKQLSQHALHRCEIAALLSQSCD